MKIINNISKPLEAILSWIHKWMMSSLFPQILEIRSDAVVAKSTVWLDPWPPLFTEPLLCQRRPQGESPSRTTILGISFSATSLPHFLPFLFLSSLFLSVLFSTSHPYCHCFLSNSVFPFFPASTTGLQTLTWLDSWGTTGLGDPKPCTSHLCFSVNWGPGFFHPQGTWYLDEKRLLITTEFINYLL